MNASAAESTPRRAKGRAGTPPAAPDEQAVERFVERLGSTLATAGFPRLPALVFAALLTDADGRMTAAELAEDLRVSPASISGGVRYLIQLRMIHRERERGSRKDLFVIADDAWHEVLVTSRSTYDPIESMLAEGADLFPVGTEVQHRLALSADFLAFIADEMAAIAARWEAHKRVAYPKA